MINRRNFKMLWLMIIFSCITSSISLLAQAGGAAVPFLLISPDARGSGMGEVGTAIADDINAVFWNPAGLGFHGYIEDEYKTESDKTPYRQVALTFSKWLPQFNADLFYSYLTAGQYFEDLDGTVAFNFIFMNLGEFTRTHESGQVLGKFISNEFALGLSYGTIIATDLSLGFQLRYIQSNLAPASAGQQGAGTGISGGFDLGLLWKPQNLNIFGWEAQDLLSLGFNLQNVGPKVTYRNESDPLPTSLRLGAAFNIVKDEFNDLKLSFDVSKLLVKRQTNKFDVLDSLGNVIDSTFKTDSDPLPKSLITGWKNPGVEFSIGTEYWYEGLVALRAGYFYEPTRLGGRKFWNFGAGVKYDIFSLDFSFINTIEENHPLANTMRFSLIVNWD
ncbi:MAG: PorV/PorQ family protein [Bacteroidetes bacterium]|nr:MAG: PorV/PorQ family protein [Bacteroidota bacterium]